MAEPAGAVLASPGGEVPGDDRPPGAAMGVGAVLPALGRAMCRWRWPVLGAWVLLVLAGAVLGGQVFDRLGAAGNLASDAESQRTDRRVDELLPEGPVIVAVVRGRDVYDPPLVDSVTRVSSELRAVPGVIDVGDLYSAPGGQIGADNRSTTVRVELAEGLPEAQRERLEDRVTAVLRRIDAPEILVGGEKLAERAFAGQAIRDATVGESIALVVLLMVLVLILGGLVAGAIPLLAALAAVAVALLGLLALTTVTVVSEFTTNVVTLLGIGLAVDYALLLIARFREERAADAYAPLAELVGRTTATAGRAVLISGLAVAAAMVGLYVFAEPLLAAMALGGAVVVLLATAVGLTAVPALIAVTHQRIAAYGADTWVTRVVARVTAAPTGLVRRIRRDSHPTTATGTAAGVRTRVEGEGVLARLAAFAQRRPGPVALAVSGGLLLLALPFVLAANLANSDARALPAEMEARRVHDVVLRDFQGGVAAPVVVVVDADPASAGVRDLMNRLNTLPHVVRMQPRPDVPGAAAVLDLTPEGDTGGPESRELVRQVRALDSPFPLLVGGPAAELVDYRSSVTSRLPLAVLVLLVGTAVLLFVLTGSLVIPVKALLLNALTLLATLGLLVVVFQWGIGASLLGVDSWGAIDLTTPVLLFVFVFGLSMDYEVFLLARISEEWERRTNRRTVASRSDESDSAVLAAIRRTGPVVTAAAVCITIVFLGFLLGDLTAVKEIGFGMSVAVILDVTLVRGLLLPAVMSLLGEWNWWAPAPLRRLRDGLRAGSRQLVPLPAATRPVSRGQLLAADVGRGEAPPPTVPLTESEEGAAG